jgi:chromosome segregation ATPase
MDNKIKLNAVRATFLFSLTMLILSVVFYARKQVEIMSAIESTEQRMTEQYESYINMYEEKINNLSSSYEERINELKRELESREVELKHIKNKLKNIKIKIIHPDGKVEEKELSYNESSYSSKVSKQIKEKFKNKIAQIERALELSYRQHIESLKREVEEKERQNTHLRETISKKESYRDKTLSLRLGLLNKNETYIGLSKNILGGFYVDFQFINDKNADNRYGLGVGIDF